MATFSNNNNNYDNIIFRSKIHKLEDSKMDSYIFRKQLKYSIPNSFISKDSFPISSFVSPIKQNLKNQVEEYHKLQSEINSMEEKIKELEISKKVKLTKVIYIIMLDRRLKKNYRTHSRRRLF